MKDNELIKATIRILIDGEASRGIAGTPILQAFQPTEQGVNKMPTAYIFKISDRRFGFPFRESRWDVDSSKMISTMLQQYETTFQLSALSTQNPSTPNENTASDLLNLMASILQSETAIRAYETTQPYAIGILRVTDVRNPYFRNDREQNEASPSFDFTLTHKQVIRTETPIVESAEFNIRSV